jgi:hypothetical protein
MSTQTDMAIQLYMQSSILLSNYYGFQTVRYSEIQERSARSGFSTLPFMPPETVRATPELAGLANSYENNPAMLDFIVKKYGYKILVKYYIRTGLRAAQLICRNHLLDLEERNQYLDFLRKEFGVAYTLASGILEATHANRTLLNAVAISRSALDGAFDVYEEYRFLNIDREAARILVEAAQNKYAEYFMKQVDLASSDSTSVAGGYTFSDAINALAVIEYQCTREGIRHLLTRSINNSPTNIEIDRETGTVMFKSAQSETSEGTGPNAPRTKVVAPPPPVVVAPSPVIVAPAPVVVVRPPVVGARPPVVVSTPGPDVVVPAEPTPPAPSVRSCVTNPPDDAARTLIAFVCPDGVIVNARRTRLEGLMNNIRPAMANRIMVVITVPGNANLRRQLLGAARSERLIPE